MTEGRGWRRGLAAVVGLTLAGAVVKQVNNNGSFVPIGSVGPALTY